MQQPHPGESRNLIVAFVASLLILALWQYFFPVRPPVPPVTQAAPIALNAPAVASNTPLPRTEALSLSPRVRIKSATVSGSIALKGARLDDLSFTRYRATTAPNSPAVTLFSPSRAETGYFADIGWSAASGKVTLPGPDTIWTADRPELTPQTPVTLSWISPEGVRFSLNLALDPHYLLTITRGVENRSPAPITLAGYGLLQRVRPDLKHIQAIVHEGPMGVFNQELTEVTYSDLEDQHQHRFTSQGGWLGLADHYWFTAFIPGRDDRFTAQFSEYQRDNTARIQADFLSDSRTLQAGSSDYSVVHLYAGPKEVALIDRYASEMQIPLFDRTVDFGRLYFLTKPIFLTLNYFYHLLGNVGLAILLLTVCIKLLLFPLANKSFLAMAKLKKLQPQMLELKERYKDDKLAMQQAYIALYKKEKVNPASGCLPILLQIPVFFALYKVLMVTIEMRHAPFYGWIHDLSAPDPTNLFTAFGMLAWNPPALLHIGAWPLIMCATMVIQQRLNPAPTDPTQAMMMRWMPFMFLFMFASFPAGLVIYWSWSNALSILQQMGITRLHKDK
jgi:YidC/Oxa1 family membrane protein insertase